MREEIDGKVILRVGRRLPGIRPVGGVYAPVAVVRIAVDDAYGAQEAIYDGVATSDLGGSATTGEFTDDVINRVTRKLEVWGTPG